MALVLNGQANTIGGLAVGGLPDGSIATADLASGVGGKILQILQTTTDSTVTNETTSFVDTNLTGNITPASTSNKILIIISQTVQWKKSGSDAGGNIKLLRGSTSLNAILPSQNNGLYSYISGTSQTNNYNVYNLTYLDSPSTTSAITYKTQCASHYADDSAQFKCQAESGKSFLTLIEVAG
tara:strand:+ start:33 stop:578 length:546 start_codon:yes stop_codon:yes gene_type:complete